MLKVIVTILSVDLYCRWLPKNWSKQTIHCTRPIISRGLYIFNGPTLVDHKVQLAVQCTLRQSGHSTSQRLGTYRDSRRTGAQSRYNRECLSSISKMDFQFWAIWAAQGNKGKKLSIMNSFEFCFFMFSWAFHFYFDAFAVKTKKLHYMKVTLFWLGSIYLFFLIFFWGGV